MVIFHSNPESWIIVAPTRRQTCKQRKFRFRSLSWVTLDPRPYTHCTLYGDISLVRGWPAAITWRISLFAMFLGSRLLSSGPEDSSVFGTRREQIFQYFHTGCCMSHCPESVHTTDYISVYQAVVTLEKNRRRMKMCGGENDYDVAN